MYILRPFIHKNQHYRSTKLVVSKKRSPRIGYVFMKFCTFHNYYNSFNSYILISSYNNSRNNIMRQSGYYKSNRMACKAISHSFRGFECRFNKKIR